MTSSTTYLNEYGQLVSLTESEIAYFLDIASTALAVTGISIDVLPFDHDTVKGNREALGLYWWSDTDPTGFITIDNYFIHECYGVEREGRYSIEPQTLADVICHELAHIQVHRHGKRHSQLTERYCKMVCKYSEKARPAA